MVEELKRVLELLATTAEDQLKHLRSAGIDPYSNGVDELALEFGDAFVFQSATTLSGDDSQALQSILQEIDLKMSQMSSKENAHLWGVDALRNHKSWAELRILAARALAML